MNLGLPSSTVDGRYRRAEDLEVVFDFALDISKDRGRRSDQVIEILQQMILLAHKNGRPRADKGVYEEAA